MNKCGCCGCVVHDNINGTLGDAKKPAMCYSCEDIEVFGPFDPFEFDPFED